MTLRVLVVIALRFYAIYFAVILLAMLPTFISLGGALGGIVPKLRVAEWVGLAGYILIPLVLWFTANRLARYLIREFDATIQIKMTLEEAYAFAFVFLGLYFFLSSLGSAVIQFAHLLSISGQSITSISQDPRSQRAAMDFYRPGITCVFGLASLLGSGAWSRKLTAWGTKKSD